MSLERGFWSFLFAFFFAPLCIGGSSKSTSAQQYTTTSTDSRVAGGGADSLTVGQGAVGAGRIAVQAAGMSNVTIRETSEENFKRLMDSLDKTNALQGQSLNGLLSGVDKVVGLAATQVETSKSTLDNKTLSLFAVAGVVVAAIAYKFG